MIRTRSLGLSVCAGRPRPAPLDLCFHSFADWATLRCTQSREYRGHLPYTSPELDKARLKFYFKKVGKWV